VILFLLYIVSIIPITLIFLHYDITGQIIIGIYLVIGTVLAFFILPRYISKALLLISSDTEGFQFDWIKPYWGSKSKLNQRVRLDELKSYKYESSYNFSTLKLRLKSGSRIQLHRWHNDSNDDFDKFMTHFKRTIESYNKQKSTTVVIEKEKSIMEIRTFLVAIGLLIGVIFIATILLVIFKGVSNMKGIIPILIVLGPLIWVIIQIVKGFHKAKIE
jgi:uncharacterized membrane protein